MSPNPSTENEDFDDEDEFIDEDDLEEEYDEDEDELDEEDEEDEEDEDELDDESGDQDLDEEDEDEDDEDDEFSLDQLSAAYAEVLKQRTGEDQDSDSESEPADRAEPDSVKQESRTEISLEEAAELEIEADIAACPVSPQTILESVLFVGGPKDVKLNSRKIAAVMRDVSPKEITALVKQLNAIYEKEGAAYRIVTDKGTLRMELSPKMNHVQHRIRGGEKAKQLSQQAVDVLAVVAYNQPIGKDRVEKIRGYSSGPIINQLVRRNLLEIEQAAGRKRVYRTTDRFLDLFGLETLEDLPQTHDVSDIEELAD